MKIRATVALLSGTSLFFVAGCSTLPHDSNPEVLSTYAHTSNKQQVATPQPGQDPDLLLRSFYSASALPSGDYAAARQYLAPEIASTWAPEGDILLVDAIDIITAADSPTDGSRAYAVRGSIIGSLVKGGAYVPENGVYDEEIHLRQVDGQWRITDLPANIVIERTELRNQYQPENLYFYDGTGRSLIADRRWVYTGQESLDTELITLLMQGPDSQIEPAIMKFLPAEAQFAGVDAGSYQFTGLSSLKEEDRIRFAAQIVWTLANAGVPAPYKISADGAPLLPNYSSLTTDDFAEFNPRIAGDVSQGIYAVDNGKVVHVSSNQVEPLNNILGVNSAVKTAEINDAGIIAAVRSTGTKSQLVMGSIDGELVESLSGDSLSRPTFENNSGAVWVVVDGKRVVRLVQSSSNKKIVESEVNIAALSGISGEISNLRLSPKGARVAMIIGGKIFTGVVARQDTGENKIVNVRELASELGGTALTLDWQPDGSLVVGTSTPETPVWRLEQDGSSVSTLPSGNITAPVSSIAASQTKVYATDANATLQLSPGDSDAIYWREVPGLQGVRSTVIVAY